ncbi:hypothetical protein COLO4_04964 [Corchorus olitorius]|uniref:Uncharacterized protein n=1 Tax=Corchorus olitorius TaxID=93759 RepID=A0A1R3KSB2_9ROSI|nr:hypothetical protein COLO4_04964 [Corchorus olitorius]
MAGFRKNVTPFSRTGRFNKPGTFFMAQSSSAKSDSLAASRTRVLLMFLLVSFDVVLV